MSKGGGEGDGSEAWQIISTFIGSLERKNEKESDREAEKESRRSIRHVRFATKSLSCSSACQLQSNPPIMNATVP